jgi:GTP-binding protein HflX
VLNKVDLLSADDRFALTMVDPTASLVSAVTGDGIESLLDTVAATIGTRLVTVRLLIPYTEGGVLAELHRVAGDLVREDGAEGVAVTARMRPEVAARWSRFSVE